MSFKALQNPSYHLQLYSGYGHCPAEAERSRPVTGRMAYVKSHFCPQHFSNQTDPHAVDYIRIAIILKKWGGFMSELCFILKCNSHQVASVCECSLDVLSTQEFFDGYCNWFC